MNRTSSLIDEPNIKNELNKEKSLIKLIDLVIQESNRQSVNGTT